jgi:hypothetical protein
MQLITMAITYFNIFSLYFDDVAAIDWGNVADYSVQLTGSPSVFAAPVPVYDSIDSADYAVTADVWTIATDYHVALADGLITIAQTLEQEWQVVLLDEQDTKTVLSSNGEKLFRNAIPGIQTMAPSLFYIQDEAADVSARTWGTSLDTTYKARLAGVDGIIGTADDNWIAGSIEGVADWLNIPWLLFIGLIAVALCVFGLCRRPHCRSLCVDAGAGTDRDGYNRPGVGNRGRLALIYEAGVK